MNGIIGFGVYALTLIPRVDHGIEKLVPHHVEAVGNVLASYAFTIAGFLSVTATFLYTMSDKPYFRLYTRRGNFGDLMFFHALAFLVLATIFVMSLATLIAPRFMHLTLALTAFSLVQLCGLTFISYMLTTRTQEDTPTGTRNAAAVPDAAESVE